MDNFLELVKKECKTHQVKLLISPEAYVDCGGGLCNGYFMDKPSPTLAVATGKDSSLWMPTLVHEFAHMQQWKENSPFWTNNKVGNFESMDLISLWLEDKIELSEEQKEVYFNKSINVEADCEKRVIELIEKYSLPINKEEYIQKANSYILFYHVVKKSRRWYLPNKEPYVLKHIYSLMPKTLAINHESITKEQEELLFTCFI